MNGNVFGKVDNEVIKNPVIKPPAKALYSLLCCYADASGYCFPGHSRLASELGLKNRTIINYLNELEQNGIIRREQTPFGKPTKTYLLHLKNKSIIP